jgi:hypothetical protein
MLFYLFYSIPSLIFSISTQAMQLVTTHPAYNEYSKELPVMTLPRRYSEYFNTSPYAEPAGQ